MSYLGKLSQEILVDSKSIPITDSNNQTDSLLYNMLLKIEKKFIENTFPVGTIIFLSNENSDPNLFLPGTWETFAEGQVIMSTTTELFVQSGEYYHTLEGPELPSHSHQFSYVKNMRSTNQDSEYGGANSGYYTTSSTGIEYGHNNMMPCSAHYCWRRVN